jgi:hypothetical protein
MGESNDGCLPAEFPPIETFAGGRWAAHDQPREQALPSLRMLMLANQGIAGS